MWGSKLKKTKAVDRWHTKAMLVDPKKTKITMLWASEPEACEIPKDLAIEEPKRDVPESNLAETLNEEAAKEDFETDSQDTAFGDRNLEPTELDIGTAESIPAETPEMGDPMDNLEAGAPNLENFDTNVTETQNVGDLTESHQSTLFSVDNMEIQVESTGTDIIENSSSKDNVNLETQDSEMQSIASNVAEPEGTCGSAENLEVGNPRVSKEPNTIASPDDLDFAEPQETESGNAAETAEDPCEFAPLEKVSLNVQFLKALENTRSMWDSDEKFMKIVQKMKKGKSLKRKEFERVYLHIHTYCRYH